MTKYDWYGTLAHRVLPDGSTMRVMPLFEGRARIGISNPTNERDSSFNDIW